MTSPLDTRLVVGYIADDRGRDAIRLAAFLAAGRRAEIEIVLVVPEHTAFSGDYPHDRGYASILEQQLGTWMTEALALVPAGIPARGHVRSAGSEAAGLIAAAAELRADMIVVGAKSGGLLQRVQVGSVANALLHTSPVAVALAPAGFDTAGPITRVTATFGGRPGADAVIDTGAQMATERGVPLRLVSLVALDGPGVHIDPGDSHALLEPLRRHGHTRLAERAAHLIEEDRARVEVASGTSIDDAVRRLDWADTEVALIGSTRLSGHLRLFVGSTAYRILRALPVPMIVVPQGFSFPTHGDAAAPGQAGGKR
ncbi:universal stress protein [Actinomycetota bacterium]